MLSFIACYPEESLRIHVNLLNLARDVHLIH